MRWEEVNDAVDGFSRVRGVQSREHQVTCFSCRQGGGDGFDIAHLTDEDHIGVLAHSRTHSRGEIIGINADFTLINHGLLVMVNDFNGIFNGHDVDFTVFIDVIDHSGHRGGLARTRRASDQDQAARLKRQRRYSFGNTKAGEGNRTVGDSTKNQTCFTATAKRVDPKTSQARHRVRKVCFIGSCKLFAQVRTHDLVHHVFGVRRREVGDLKFAQTTINAHAWGRSGLAVQVGTATLNEGSQKGLNRLSLLIGHTCLSAGSRISLTHSG